MGAAGQGPETKLGSEKTPPLDQVFARTLRLGLRSSDLGRRPLRPPLGPLNPLRPLTPVEKRAALYEG
eukprot:scaffold34492_cov60-Phaeocystis_antarctica.AAC.4